MNLGLLAQASLTGVNAMHGAVAAVGRVEDGLTAYIATELRIGAGAAGTEAAGTIGGRNRLSRRREVRVNRREQGSSDEVRTGRGCSGGNEVLSGRGQGGSGRGRRGADVDQAKRRPQRIAAGRDVVEGHVRQGGGRSGDGAGIGVAAILREERIDAVDGHVLGEGSCRCR